MRTTRIAQPSATALRIHVENLLAEHLVSVDYLPGERPVADPAARHVVIPPVTDNSTYATALAQIARVVAGYGLTAELWCREHSLLVRRRVRAVALA